MPSRPRRDHAPAAFEPLEARALLYSWTAQEVYFAELVNRARANPAAESQRLGITLTTGLTLSEIALIGPKEPLALDASLGAASRAHSLDMAARAFFDHINPDGLNPTNRAQSAGYAGTAGENIGAGYGSIDALYAAWMTQADERKNILSLFTNFDAAFHYTQIGPGFARNVTNAPYPHYYTVDFGAPGVGGQQARTPWLTGVVYTDANHDAFYSIGEGLAGVRVDVFAGATTAGVPVATYTTDAAGNYQVPLAAGSYTVLFTRLADGNRVSKPVTVTTQNVKVDAMASELAPPPPPPDDYADAGQWAQAAPISLDGAGNGQVTGSLEVHGDTDLFTLTAPRSGLTHIVGAPAGGSFVARIRVYNAAGSLVATGSPGAPAANSALDVTVAAGSTYYILIDAVPGATGDYTLTIQGPPIQPQPDPLPPEVLGGPGAVTPIFYTGKPVLAFMNQAGEPIVAIRSALGVWSSTDLQAATGSPRVDTLTAWVEPRDGLLYAAGRSSAGVILYKRATNGAWSFRNLTGEIKVSRPIVSNLATFVDASGLRQIAGLDAAGHMVTYWMTGLMWPQGWRYYFTDIAGRDLRLRARAVPDLSGAGTITSYVTQRNSLNILTTDGGGNVILFFRPGGGLATQLWNWVNLTTGTHAAPMVGAITAVETSSRVVTISGTAADGNLWVITWRSGLGWRSTNATVAAAASGAPGMSTGGVGGWGNLGGVSFIAGLSASGDLVLYRYQVTGGQDRWAVAGVTIATPNAPRLVGPVRATFSAGSMIIAGLTADGEVVRFTYTPGGSWTAESVSALL